MGNTQAKLSAGSEKIKHDTNCNKLKRRASSASLDISAKRRAIALKTEDIDDTHDQPPKILKDRRPYEALRDHLDEDEKFLELPQLFDLVAAVAKKHGMDDGPLHRSYRGQDVLLSLESKPGLRNVSMLKVRNFRPVTAIIDSVDVGTGEQHKHETFVLGRGQEEDPQWLNVSYHLDTQIPHVVLRVPEPSMKDSNGEPKPIYVYIFATNLARAPHMPIRIRTGKGVKISKRRTKRLRDIRPRLLKKAQDGLLTETSLHLNRVDKGVVDVEGRVSRPTIVGNISRTELDRMTAEVIGGKADQPAHEKLLGLIHGDKIREGLDLYSEYDGHDNAISYARETNFCNVFRLAMIVCNELGNFWAYRLQFPDISWTDENFPFEKLQPLRWTIRKWFAREDDKSDGQAVVAALPAQWQAINRPKVLPGVEEELFLRGLDTVEDDPSSMRVFVRMDLDTTTGDSMATVQPA